MAANLSFSHPKMPEPLAVHINPNQIEWSYGLNTQGYPTYGGEVIQILSCFIEDMEINGNIQSYHQMEEIYRWFITYIQVATTGVGSGKFKIEPVSMTYSERGWQFNIYPKSMPGFRYGTEVVVPEWTLGAAIVDPAQDTKDLQDNIISSVTTKALEGQEIELFGRATGEIGYTENNPFDDPLGNVGKLGEENRKKLLHGENVKQGFNQLADEYNKFLPAYLEDNFSSLTANYSKPAVPNPNKGAASTKGKVKKNG